MLVDYPLDQADGAVALIEPLSRQPWYEEPLDETQLAPLAIPDPVYLAPVKSGGEPLRIEAVNVRPADATPSIPQGELEKPAGGTMLPFTGQIITKPPLPVTEPTAATLTPSSSAAVAAGGKITLAGKEFDRRDVYIAAAAIAALWFLA